MKFSFISLFIKSLLVLIGLSFISFSLSAQDFKGVGIGTTNPDQSALLDLSSNNKGLLLPRMTLQQRSSINQPAQGLLVYQTDFLNGLYVYTGSDWSPISLPATANLTTNATSWNTLGNANLDANSFLGTTDDFPLVFKVKNEFAGLLDSKRSNTFLGFKTGWATQSFNSVVMGAYALQRASTGNDNVVIGYQSMFSHEDGQYNVSVGSLSSATNVTGSKNTVVGAMAGYRSRGSSNVLIGFQAGYFEQGSDKLYIHNNASQVPLIYGDFKANRLGINATNLGNTLTINSGENDNSGLQLQRLTSASATKESNKKVLSVDENGNVILVPDMGQNSSTDTTTTDNFWVADAYNIVNKNAGLVRITNGLTVGETITSKRLEVADGGIVFKKVNAFTSPLASNGKVLTLDTFGNVILVNDAVGSESEWSVVGSDVINKNVGKVFIKKDIDVAGTSTAKGMIVGTGGLKLQGTTSASRASTTNGKVLSVDSQGNVVLVNDVVGRTDPTYWKQTNGRVELKQTSKVVIGDGITKFPDAYNLFVSKGILAERVRVAVPNSEKWADYVFKPNYRLMPLKEVEKFILSYGYLPNMFSADDAAKNGMDVLEMSIKLLEKVEELTLYSIEANEQILKANKRIEDLERRLSKLEK